jgi:phage terminase small subunit
MTLKNAKHEMFCLEFIVDLNATGAARRAGYSEKTANRIGYQLLAREDVNNRIVKLKQERSNKTKINAEWVLNQLVEIHNLDVIDILDNCGNFKSISDWPMQWRRYLSGLDISEINISDTETIIRKIKWPDKVKNLELIGKHVDIQAFKEKVDTNISGDLKVEQTLAERLSGGSKR